MVSYLNLNFHYLLANNRSSFVGKDDTLAIFS